MPKEQVGTELIKNNERCWKYLDYYAYDTEDFELLGKAFEENFNVQTAKIGNAECKLFYIKDAVDFAKEWLAEHRNY